MWPRRCVVADGGTAGWLAAKMLGDFARRGRHACDVMVTGSSKIGTIGAGAGMSAVFSQRLHHALAGNWLRSKAGAIGGTYGWVSGVERGGTGGGITALALEGGVRVAVDFFVDQQAA